MLARPLLTGRALSVRLGVRAKAVRVDDREVPTGGLDQAEDAQRAQGAAGGFERRAAPTRELFLADRERDLDRVPVARRSEPLSELEQPSRDALQAAAGRELDPAGVGDVQTPEPEIE
jgi:hypothetical protein